MALLLILCCERGILGETLWTFKYDGSMWSTTREEELGRYPLAVSTSYGSKAQSNIVVANDGGIQIGTRLQYVLTDMLCYKCNE